MVEKMVFLLIFVICIGLMVNLVTKGALFRSATALWARVRDWPAARRRKVYQLNEFRATRERGRAQTKKSRSTSDQ